MIDLHMHSILSDGELLPAEVARRAFVIGCSAIAITDHVDESNVGFVTESIVRFANDNDHQLTVLPGVEITHVHPSKIASIAESARKGGAKVIVVHGETVVEPVEEGTNSAAIDAGADILAHPGLITPELVKKAERSGIALELSGRGGHSFTNGHVAKLAIEYGAKLVFNSDSHAPRDLLDREMALKIIRGAGLDEGSALAMFENSKKLVEKVSGSL